MSIEDKIHKIKKARISEEEILVQYIIDKTIFDDEKSTKIMSYWIYDSIIAFRIDKDGRYKDCVCLNTDIRNYLMNERNLEKDEIKRLISHCINKTTKLVSTPVTPEKIVFFNF